MFKKDVSRVVGRAKNITRHQNAAYSLEDFESGKIAINPGWLKEVWGKWPGDESVDELLAAFVNESGTLTGKVDV